MTLSFTSVNRIFFLNRFVLSNKVIELIERHVNTIHLSDGKYSNAFEKALGVKANDMIILAILLKSLPFDQNTGD
jgi:hypothetical protein